MQQGTNIIDAIHSTAIRSIKMSPGSSGIVVLERVHYCGYTLPGGQNSAVNGPLPCSLGDIKSSRMR